MLQALQVIVNFAPHSEQNLRPSVISCLHLGHFGTFGPFFKIFEAPLVTASEISLPAL